MSLPSPTTAGISSLGGATMGTTWSAKLVVSPHADLHGLHALCEQQLAMVVAQMSTWEANSDISRFNRAESGQWQRLPAEFHQVLSYALQVAQLSDGAFDPTVGALVGLWGFGAEASEQRIPDDTEFRNANSRAGWQRLLLQEQPPAALQAGGIKLDLSAIAKGFAVDLVAQNLRGEGISAALVEVGGELYAYGCKPDGSPWRVVVEATPDLDDDAEAPRILDLKDLAVATSGDRWHHFDQAGRRYSHTLDPRTGAPVAHAPAAVTVVAAQAMHADAWATALTVMGAKAGLQFAAQHGLAARFVSRGATGFEETMTDAFKARLTQ